MNSTNEQNKHPELSRLKKPRGFLYNFVKITGAIPTVIALRPKIIYEGGKKIKFKNAMLCANHVGLVDPILVMCAFWYKNVYSLATTDLYRTPLMAWFFNGIFCIPVDKKNFSMDSFHAVTDKLGSGRAVLIFPEGGVNQGEKTQLQALKSGVVLMAFKTNSPIIPMYIVPARKWYSRRAIVIGKPLDIKEICGERPGMRSIEKMTQVLHDKENQLKELYYSEYSKEKKI